MELPPKSCSDYPCVANFATGPCSFLVLHAGRNVDSGLLDFRETVAMKTFLLGVVGCGNFRSVDENERLILCVCGFYLSYYTILFPLSHSVN